MAEQETVETKAEARSAEEVAASYFDATARGDAAAMGAHWHPDGIDDIVPLGIFRGPAEVEQLFSEIFAAFDPWEFRVTRITPGDRVVPVEWRISALFTGAPFQGILPTGRRIELRGCDCVEVEDGLIVRNTAYYDGAAMARGIGLLPPQDSGAERMMRGAFNGVTRLRGALRARRSR